MSTPIDYDALTERVIAEAVQDMKPTFREDARGAMNKAVAKAVSDIVDDTCRAKIAEAVNAHLAAPRQATTSYGEPTGDPKSLGEWLVEEIRNYMDEKVNPADGLRRQYNQRDWTEPRWRYMIRTIATAEVSKALAPVAAKAAAAAHEDISKIATKALTTQLGRAIAGLRP